MIQKYLYNCYCGPVRVREDEKDKHPGYIYLNCPRISAPPINTPKLSEIKDLRIVKMYNNLNTYIQKMIDLNITKAVFVGSFVRGDHTYKSDIDLIIYTEDGDQKNIEYIQSCLNSIDDLSFDINYYKYIYMMPHMEIDKGDRILLFDLSTNYIYNEFGGNK